MFLKSILLVICIALQYCAFSTHQREFDDENNDDDYALYRRCNHRITFTEQELEIARQYYISKFANASIKPKRESCQRIKVRHDFRCLTHRQRLTWIDAYKQLYLNDSLVNLMSELHARYWPAWHKTLEGVSSHLLMINILERALNNIVPGMTMPYWDAWTVSTHPEKDMIWDYLGRAGDKSNGYCIRGGMFDDVFLTREQRCLRREWNPDGTIPGWYSPEYYTSLLQNTNFTFVLSALFMTHFKVHLNTGGYNGDISVKVAPNDPLFYLYHNQGATQLFQYLLQTDPTDLLLQFASFGKYDFNTGIMGPSDLETDRIAYFKDKYVIEPLQYGYGDQCSLTDSDIEYALYETSNTRPPLPLAVQRLRESLSHQRFAALFPNFASGNYTSLQIYLFEVGNRNRGTNCRLIPRSLNYIDNANNRRQLEALKWEIFDLASFLLPREGDAKAFIDELNRSGYCSPYV